MTIAFTPANHLRSDNYNVWYKEVNNRVLPQYSLRNLPKPKQPHRDRIDLDSGGYLTHVTTKGLESTHMRFSPNRHS